MLSLWQTPTHAFGPGCPHTGPLLHQGLVVLQNTSQANIVNTLLEVTVTQPSHKKYLCDRQHPSFHRNFSTPSQKSYGNRHFQVTIKKTRQLKQKRGHCSYQISTSITIEVVVMVIYIPMIMVMNGIREKRRVVVRISNILIYSHIPYDDNCIKNIKLMPT